MLSASWPASLRFSRHRRLHGPATGARLASGRRSCTMRALATGLIYFGLFLAIGFAVRPTVDASQRRRSVRRPGAGRAKPPAPQGFSPGGLALGRLGPCPWTWGARSSVKVSAAPIAAVPAVSASDLAIAGGRRPPRKNLGGQNAGRRLEVFTIVILSEAKDLVAACHWHEIPSATLRAGLRFAQDDWEESAHDADPLHASDGRHTPQHCAGLSRAKRHRRAE